MTSILLLFGHLVYVLVQCPNDQKCLTKTMAEMVKIGHFDHDHN